MTPAKLSAAELNVFRELLEFWETQHGAEHVKKLIASHDALAAENERLAAELAEAKHDAAGWKRSFESQNGEIRKLSDAMADHEDAIERLRDVGKAIGCGHVDNADERLQIVRCVEETVSKLEAELAAAQQRLAALAVDGADAIELRKIAWANYGAIYAQQKGEALESYESSTPERRARIDKAADAVAARVRAPFLRQIAELTEKLAAAERTAKAANDGREHAVRNQDRLAAELADTKQALAEMTRVKKRYQSHLGDRTAELERTQQALADARGEVERVRSNGKPFVEFAKLLSPDLPEWMECRFQANGNPMPTVGDWRDLRTMLEALPPSPAAANQAREAAEKALAEIWGECCPDCGPQQYELFAGLLSKMTEEQRQRAEAAEAAAGVTLEMLKATEHQLLRFGHGFWECNCRDLAQDGRVCNKHELAARITRTIKAATDPGRAANELGAGKALAGKIRDALCSVEAIAHVERALADYDKALAQGEQRGEGQRCPA